MTEPCGDRDSAPALPGSDTPSGICTVRRGPLGRGPAPGPPAAAPPVTWRLFARPGGVKELSAPEEDVEAVRETSRLVDMFDRFFSWGDAEEPPQADASDCERLSAEGAGSGFTDCASEVKEARCWERMERLSSMGVKMLCDFF